MMVDYVQTRMTASEFWALPETDERRELIEGEVIVMGTPIPEHQRVVFGTGKLVDRIKPDGEVFIAPLEVYLDEINIPQPDVMWVAKDSKCVIAEKRLEGAPDLVVEVLSPSTAKNDKEKKFEVYQKHQVREYWIADPVYLLVEVFQLKENVFVRQGVFGVEDTFASAVLGGQTVEVKAIFGG